MYLHLLSHFSSCIIYVFIYFSSLTGTETQYLHMLVLQPVRKASQACYAVSVTVQRLHMLVLHMRSIYVIYGTMICLLDNNDLCLLDTSFLCCSPLSRQDLVSWKMALEKRQLPEANKKVT